MRQVLPKHPTVSLAASLACVCLLASGPRARANPTTGVVEGTVSTKPSKYREHVVVYLEKVPGAFRPNVKPVVYDQKGMKFEPHVLPVVRGTKVRFQNSDSVRHNVFTPDGEKYNLGTWAQGEFQDRVFATSGVYRQLCNVHPEMEGFIVVLDNPFFAVTAADGTFKLENVPPGSYTLHAWSEKLPASTAPITITAGASTHATFELRKP